MTVSCHACGQPFENYGELAFHISSTRDKAHRKGKRWAAKYLHRANLNKRDNDRGKIPLTEEQKDAKEDLKRELSGNTEMVLTYCLGCKTGIRQPVPVEYSQSPNAWRTGNGTLIMPCPRCQMAKR